MDKEDEKEILLMSPPKSNLKMCEMLINRNCDVNHGTVEHSLHFAMAYDSEGTLLNI